MLIDMEVALGLHGQVDIPMARNLFQHVVEEAHAGGDVALSLAVEIDLHELSVSEAGGVPGLCAVRLSESGRSRPSQLYSVWLPDVNYYLRISIYNHIFSQL